MKIIISGVVGAGKSTISHQLAKKLNFKLMEEPVVTNPYIDDFYKDPKSFSFKMQVFMLMARSKQLKDSLNIENVIFDRTIIEDPIFVEVLKTQNNISDTDYKVYTEFYQDVICSGLYFDPQLKPDLIVYLKVSAETAIKRIQERGRESEKIVPASYWKLLNTEYEKWYQKNKDKFPFLVLDCNEKNPEEIVQIIIEYIKK